MLLPDLNRTGRVLACEVLVATQAVRNVIATGFRTTPHLPATGAIYGMQSLEASLAQLSGRTISCEIAAMTRASPMPLPAR